jgi:hypothetical protein
MGKIESWRPLGVKPEDTRVNPNTGELEARVELYTGPTPIAGENGQLKLAQEMIRRRRRLAQTAISDTE